MAASDRKPHSHWVRDGQGRIFLAHPGVAKYTDSGVAPSGGSDNVTHSLSLNPPPPPTRCFPLHPSAPHSFVLAPFSRRISLLGWQNVAGQPQASILSSRAPTRKTNTFHPRARAEGSILALIGETWVTCSSLNQSLWPRKRDSLIG